MEGMERYDDVAPRRVAMASMAAIEAGDREAWLSLFAEDALVADPVGVSPFDSEGHGHRGAAAIAAFFDSVIAGASIGFVIRESYASGNECANVGTITSTFPDGAKGIVDGIYTYRIDDDERIVSLRAHWEWEHLRVESPAT